MPTRQDQAAARTAFLTALCLTSGLAAAPARGQVLEITERGAVVVHDRPEVTVGTGATVIRPSRAAAQTVSPSPRRHTTDLGRMVVPTKVVVEAASLMGLSPALLEAVSWQESRHHAWAVSPKGAIGEMQLMPETARRLGVDPYVSAQNYLGGAAYLSLLLRRYAGDLPLALAAYNAGPAAVDRYHGSPPFKETRAYVAAILARLSRDADFTEKTLR